MDRKAKLPPPLALDHLTRPTAADANLTSSSSSSSSFSDSEFLRQAHAVFKRHRPLGGTLSNVRRASRIVVPQTEPLKNITSMSESREDVIMNKTVDGPRRLINATIYQEGKHEGLVVCPIDDRASSFSLHKCNDAVPTDQEKSFLTVSSSQVPPSHVLRNDDMKKENIQFQELESHLGNQMGTRGHQNMELFDTGMEFGVSTMLENTKNPKYNQCGVEPVTGISVVSSSCITTFSTQTGATIQSAQTLPIGKTAFPTQVSSSAGEVSLAIKDDVPPKEQVAAKKDCDVNLDRQSNLNLAESVPDNGVSGAAIPVQTQDLPTCITSSDSNKGQSKPSKVEKSRTKKYDPNVFFKVNEKFYQKLGKIGSGGSSEVYKVISSDCTIYALKKIKLRGRDYPTAYGFCQEIEYLNKLKGKSNIIQLIDYEVTDKTLFQEVEKGSMNMKERRIKGDECIYMVLEYGEIDLAHMLSQKRKETSTPGLGIEENWLRFYWQQMLEAVSTIHEERIVHSDLKPANFLLVRGSLKLIDFGIAKAIMSDTTNIQRDSQVGTLNYMSPEAFMCNEPDTNGNIVKCGRSSDIWSLGCILYQMVYGKTPFADYKSFWAKFKVVTDMNHKITYEQVSNPWLIDIMQKCLAWDRNKRWRIPQLLQHPFLVPRVPKELHPLDDDNPYRLLVEKICTYWTDPRMSRICCDLNEVIAKIERTKTTSVVSSAEPNIS